MRNSTLRYDLATAVCALFALGGVAATHRAAAADTGTTAEATAPVGLETIEVTARRRTETVQDVPVDVTAVSGTEIARMDLSSLEKLSAATPDFTVGRASNGSGAQLTLRGIGSSSTSIGIEQSVAVVVDDVYYGQGRVIEEGFFDLNELELLKGPQALFFGKNATAGVVSLSTADPTRESEFLTKVAYEIESKTTQAEAIVSGPLTDTLAARVSVRGSVMDGGYYKNESQDITFTTLDVANGFAPTTHIAPPAPSQEPGEREFLGRITLKWTPNDALTGTLKLSSDYNYVNNSSWDYVDYSCIGGVSTLGPPAYPCKGQFVTHQNALPADIAANFPYAKGNGQPYNDYQSYSATGTLNYKLQNFALTSVTNYQTNNNTWLCDCNFQSTSNGTWATEDSTWTAISEEFRALSSFDFPLNFMAGVLAQKTTRVFDQWISTAGLADSAAPPQDEYVVTAKHSTTDGKTYAAFAQAIWKVVPEVEATAGLRYTHETKDSIFYQGFNNPAVVGIFRPENVPLGVVTANQVFNNVSPQAGITWKPMTDIMLYAAYNTGYKSGGFDNSGINSAGIPNVNAATYMAFKPEKAKGFELGTKTTTFSNQLRVNFTLFDYKYTDLQVQFFNSSTFAFLVVSADAETRGAELDVEYAPETVSGLTLNANFNYDQARYTNFIGPCYSGETPAAGCNIPTATLPFQDLTGKPLGMAPKTTGVVGARYSMPLGGKDTHVDYVANARYSGAYNPSSFNNPLSHEGSYTVLDASLRLFMQDDKYEFAVVGKNLTNRFYVNGVVDGPSTGGGTGTAAGIPADQLGFGDLPRTIQFQAQARF